jgi:hypothetical protein
MSSEILPRKKRKINKEISSSYVTNLNNDKLTHKKRWCVPASIVSKRTVNPIREVVYNMKVTPNPNKEHISLALGKLFIVNFNRTIN